MVSISQGDIPSVVEFYKDKHILLTGGTGFIGKVLIEKLLRSCDVAKIYCLIRPKKGQDADERLDSICQEQLFGELRAQCPDFQSRLQAIHGDITEEGLGISDTDRRTLEEHVQLVIHSAATVKFDESLKLAVTMNMLGVRRLIQLCKNLNKLEVLVHISTAYANCERPAIEEVVYPTEVQPQNVIDTIGWINDDLANTIAPKLISPKPNTYTYTKQLAETLLVQEGGDLPVCIIRPSIVTSSWAEPYTGWIDNFNGVSGLGLATGKGLLQSCHAEPNFVADIIPVDFVSNIIIAAGWYTTTHKDLPNARVYHITSGATNPLTWREMVNYGVKHLEENPMEMCFRRPKFNMLTPNRYLHSYWVLVSHLIPAYLADFIIFIIGKKPRMVRLYDRLHKATKSLEYFTVREWTWTHKNTDSLKAAMSMKDQQIFPFDPVLIDWEKYMQDYCVGVKKFMLKEDPDNVETAKAHVRRLRNLRYCFNLSVLAVMYWFIKTKSCLVKHSHTALLRLVYKLVEMYKYIGSQFSS